LLRKLVIAAGAGQAPASTPPVGRRDGARVMVRLTPTDAAGLDAEAALMGLSRAGWIAALVRRRIRGRPTFGRRDELAVMAIQTELRRIGVNVNQIARALNTAVLEGKVLELEIDYLDALRVEIAGHLRDLRQAMEGNLAYWDAEP
jgi:hypothetical protein